MADRIMFNKKINVSVQVGDELWYSVVSSSVSPTTPELLGMITAKGDTWVEVDPQFGTLGQQPSTTNLITNGDFSTQQFGPNIAPTNGTFDNDISSWVMAGANDIAYHATDDPNGNGLDSVGNILDSSNRMYIDAAGFASGGYVIQNLDSHGIVGNDFYDNGYGGTSYQLTLNYQLNPDNSGNYNHFQMKTGVHPGINGGQFDYLTSTDGTVQYFTKTIVFLESSDDPSNPPYIQFYGQSTSLNSFGYIDDIEIREKYDFDDWYTDSDGSWDIKTSTYTNHGNRATKIKGEMGYLYQDYATSLVEGEEYTLTMHIRGDIPDDGDIKIVNTASSSTVDVDVLITPDGSGGATGIATWTQGSVNNSKLNIYGAEDVLQYFIDNITLYKTSFDLNVALSSALPENLFFMFKKPSDQNIASLNGYYAETTLTNSSNDKRELFVVGSEVTISSK